MSQPLPYVFYCICSPYRNGKNRSEALIHGSLGFYLSFLYTLYTFYTAIIDFIELSTLYYTISPPYLPLHRATAKRHQRPPSAEQPNHKRIQAPPICRHYVQEYTSILRHFRMIAGKRGEVTSTQPLPLRRSSLVLPVFNHYRVLYHISERELELRV